MGAFGGLIMTNAGRNLQTKAQTGVELHYTRVGVGDGELGGDAIVNLTDLKHEVKSLDITHLRLLPDDGQAVVGTIISNSGLETGFYFREIGIFANDPDIGEILYCYGNAGAAAEFIPADGGPDIIEKTIDVIVSVGNAENVSATINHSLVFATPEEVQALIDDHADRRDNPHEVTLAQIGAVAQTDFNDHLIDLTPHLNLRDLYLTYSGDDLTKVEEKEGTTVKKTTELAYNGSDLSTVTITAGNETITLTLSYTVDKLTQVTKSRVVT